MTGPTDDQFKSTLQEDARSRPHLFTMMKDPELMKKAHEASHIYLQNLVPHIVGDFERETMVFNAVAAGYSKGYRDAQKEVKDGSDTPVDRTV